MTSIDKNLFDISHMDTLASGNSVFHRLDPRAKLVTTLIFIGTVVSFGKYEISGMIPFVIFPVILITVGHLPVGYLAKKIIIVAPFAFFVGILNPYLDRTVLLEIYGYGISGGWISFFSIMMRFALTVGTALILISLTGFHSVCMALEKLGVPRPFVIQLLFLYRYIFVLIDEAAHMVRARALRSFGSKGNGIRPYGSMLGHLLLRTLDRAQRIHLAMCCRGFDGTLRILKPLNIGISEILFVTGWSSLFLAMRFFNIPQIIGSLIMEFV